MLPISHLPSLCRLGRAGRAGRPSRPSRPGRHGRPLVQILAGLVAGLIAVVAGLFILLPGTVMASESRGEEPSFDWDGAWEAAEEHAREQQRLLEKARRVNEGRLTFITTPPDPDGARMEKRVDLERESLDDGWARMHQCHHNLDPAAAVQVVYNDERTRDIQITRRDGVGRAEVDGPSVQMRDIERGASLCVAAQVLAIRPHPDKAGYVVDNGPFMRRFLDGYYPMQVRLEVRWPEGMLAFEESSPPAQPGLAIESSQRGVTLEAHFEGRLESRLHLVRGADTP